MATTSEAISTRPQHLIATNRSLDTLLAWSQEFLRDEAEAGRKVIVAPSQALRGGVSLREWILSRARRSLGESAPNDVPTLLSGAADTLVITDPGSADATSLRWLGNLLTCAELASDMAATPPLPKVVALVPTMTQRNAGTTDLMTRLNSLGAREERIAGRQVDPDREIIQTEIQAMRGKYGDILAALGVSPVPLEVSELDQLAKASRTSANAPEALTSGALFRVIGGYCTPTNAMVVKELRKSFDSDDQRRGAKLLLKIFGDDATDPYDAKIDLELRVSGDDRTTVNQARRRFEEHYAAGKFEEALRILRVVRELKLTLATGRHAGLIDEAKQAALFAETGEHERAKPTIDDFAKRRELFPVRQLIEWTALAARTLALREGYEPRQADSLMRRAIRMVKDDTDQWVRLRLLRVELLRSPIFRLEDRADWLLSHVSNKILAKVTQPTLAAFYDEIATRMFTKGDFKGAMKRLRRLGALPTSNERLGRAMMLMARCRVHFRDYEAAYRYANNALHYGVRGARPEIVEEAVAFLRALEKDRPKRLPRLKPPPRGRGIRSRLPAASEILTPQSAEASQLFDILEARFNVNYWVRRRAGKAEYFGDSPGHDAVNMSVYQELPDGEISSVTRGNDVAGDGLLRGVVLMRADGDDMVLYRPNGESRDDAIVQFLLTDRGPSASTESISGPARKAVVDEYMRRALDQGVSRRGLHHTMETLFNKDVLIFFEEQGFSKEEMAEKLGVSRATLYRMYARAGLN